MSTIIFAFLISVDAGLPDHNHNVPYYAGSCTGGSPYQRLGWSNPTSNLATKNASESNPIYGNSDTVTPLSLSCMFIISY